MRIHPRLLIVPALLAALQAASAADITGTITLSGTPPDEKVIDAMEQNAQCAAMHTDPVKTQFYLVGSKGELKDVVVSIKGLTGKSTGESAPPLVLDQKGCEYIPYVSAVQTKQKILIRTEDQLFHNVDIVPAVAENAAAIAGHSNVAQGPGAADLTVAFPAEESFLKFKCDVHPWMFSYVTVVDNPYFDVSAKDGTYKIANVPPGTYTVEAAHRKAGKVTKSVEVKDANVTLDFTLEVPK